MLTCREALALEPQINCTGALLSPSTGILDSHAYMLALLGDAEEAGAVIAFGAKVKSGKSTESDIILDVEEAGGTARLATRVLVNCAGLSAQTVAATIEGVPARTIPPLRLAKGNYFALAGRAPFTRLVYPVPEPGGLGVHLTIDLGGQAKFGPDVEWIERLDYNVDPARGERFYAEVRKYWPGLKDGALAPAYAGIRPKLSATDGYPPDFVIQGPRDHGVGGLVNLYGIESPGLTASLAIAEHALVLLGAKPARSSSR
jgi:L-2-hydroxyglutarate oxidase LhgO